MESRDSTSPRPKFRFGFKGRSRPSRPPGERHVTVDEILDSLGRRIEMSDRFDRDASVVLDDEDLASTGPTVSQGFVLRGSRVVMGKFVFLMVLLVGVFVLWTYGVLKSVANLAAVERLVQGPSYLSLFTDPVRLVVLVSVCLVPVLLLRRRRSVERFVYE